MADGRDQDQQTTGQQGQASEYGEQRGENRMGNQGSEGSFGGESSGSQSGSADPNGSSISTGSESGSESNGMGGQPIGGNDSNTGSGTTLTQGADFEEQRSRGETSSDNQGEDTLTAHQDSNAGTGTTGESGGFGAGAGTSDSGDGSSDEGFIGSQATGSDEYLQARRNSGESSAGSGARTESPDENDASD